MKTTNKIKKSIPKSPFHRAAKWSFILTILAIVLALFVALTFDPVRLSEGEVYVANLLATLGRFILIGAFSLAFISLFGIRKYGSKGILLKACFTLLISFCVLAVGNYAIKNKAKIEQRMIEKDD